MTRLQQDLRDWARVLRATEMQQTKYGYYRPITDDNDSALDDVTHTCAIGAFGKALHMSFNVLHTWQDALPKAIRDKVIYMNDTRGATFNEIADYLDREAKNRGSDE